MVDDRRKLLSYSVLNTNCQENIGLSQKSEANINPFLSLDAPQLRAHTRLIWLHSPGL